MSKRVLTAGSIQTLSDFGESVRVFEQRAENRHGQIITYCQVIPAATWAKIEPELRPLLASSCLRAMAVEAERDRRG